MFLFLFRTVYLPRRYIAMQYTMENCVDFTLLILASTEQLLSAFVDRVHPFTRWRLKKYTYAVPIECQFSSLFLCRNQSAKIQVFFEWYHGLWKSRSNIFYYAIRYEQKPLVCVIQWKTRTKIIWNDIMLLNSTDDYNFINFTVNSFYGYLLVSTLSNDMMLIVNKLIIPLIIY